MPSTALKIEGLWKQYDVAAGQREHGTFYDLLAHSISSPLKRIRRLGGTEAAAEQFVALRDVNFDVDAGQVVGIIGRNGAGKSTLLKILSRITAPTRGRISVHGRMASLLEVGTGFHPELSGRENIFLNGAIMGMTRQEVASKFDEIVAFSEVGEFIDTPVKRYSSGMYVRLAFAVAAHLETDILLVDEVLAVGDAAFQRKSMGRMGDVAKGGRTVLFVSHNLAAMRNLCTRALVFEKGSLTFDGSVGEGIAHYERAFGGASGLIADTRFRGALAGQIRFDGIICKQEGQPVEFLDPLRPFQLELRGYCAKAFPVLELKISMFRDGFLVTSCHDTAQETGMAEGEFISQFDVPAGVFRSGRYSIGIGASASTGLWVWGADAAVLDFSEIQAARSADRSEGAVSIPYNARRIQQP